MDQVSVIGLGLMGTAFAEAFLREHLTVTVWNRTSSRCNRLRAQGASVASTVASAVAASDVLVVCVSNYAVTDELLGSKEVSATLNGKAIIQLSTGTPKEARVAAARAREIGAQYLDGAILAYPSHIGSAKAQILIAGSVEVFNQHGELLQILGTTVFVGQNPGAASALDCATLTSSILATLALIHGAALCESEGVEIEQLVSMVNARLPIRAELNSEIAEKIRTQRYDKPQTSLGTWAGVARHLAHISQENHLAHDVPRFVSQLLERAVAKGLGDQEIASLIKIIRADGIDKANVSQGTSHSK
jgi:3-hydroxyisobutyrate dehydrogenase-like beta-hydroxyacid dehydrogenase